MTHHWRTRIYLFYENVGNTGKESSGTLYSIYIPDHFQITNRYRHVCLPVRYMFSWSETFPFRKLLKVLACRLTLQMHQIDESATPTVNHKLRTILLSCFSHMTNAWGMASACVTRWSNYIKVRGMGSACGLFSPNYQGFISFDSCAATIKNFTSIVKVIYQMRTNDVPCPKCVHSILSSIKI